MLQRFAFLASLLALLGMSAVACAEKLAAKPKQFLLTVRYQEENGSSRVVSVHDLRQIDNETSGCMEGGEYSSDARKEYVEYGTRIDARVKRLEDGRIQLNFVAEHSSPDRWDCNGFEEQLQQRVQIAVMDSLSCPRYAAIICGGEAIRFICERGNAIDADVHSLPTDRVFGTVTMKLGAIYRVHTRMSGQTKSWWEFKVVRLAD